MESFKIIKDPRINRTKKHRLIDIIVIAVCGSICGCDTWVEIEDFGKEKIDWFSKFLELQNGIPSHDTFGRVFSILNPDEFQEAFYNWTKAVFKVSKGEIISIDGKYFSATENLNPHIEKRGKKLLGTVNAWASKAGVALAQKRIDFDKKCEHIVMKDLINFLDVKGHIVTMDAAGAHAQTVNLITNKGGDYCVSLKNNQRLIKKQSLYLFERCESDVDTFETIEQSHGRKETRTCEIVKVDNQMLDWMEKKGKQRKSFYTWEKLCSVIKVVSKREIKKKESCEVRYFLTSLEVSARRALEIVRSHWGVENKLHWSLDVSFNEDRSTIRKGYGSENMSLLRKYALNLLRGEKTEKKSINRKRLKAALSSEYMVKVIEAVK